MEQTPQHGQNDPDALLERELGLLKAEYEKLRDEKVRADETLAHLESQLAELSQRAQSQYGTADPGELRAKLSAMRTENARLVEEYRDHITAMRAGLAELEQGVEQGEGHGR